MGAVVITIEVRGLPAPQGSKRHVGRGIMVESSKAVGPWREAVRAETQRVMDGREPLDVALHVVITFAVPRPKSHYRTGRNAALLKESAPYDPAGQPDLDKLVRAVLDGVTAGGAWTDDSLVVRLGAQKLYDGTPGARITIAKMEDLRS
jgi:Holliday junction resolvase RusA-like endonuclease